MVNLALELIYAVYIEAGPERLNQESPKKAARFWRLGATQADPQNGPLRLERQTSSCAAAVRS